MAIVSFEEFLKQAGGTQDDVQVLSPQSSKVVSDRSMAQKFGSFSLGVGKGLAESAIGTSRMLQTAGQGVLAAVSPKSFDEVQSQTGFQSLQGEQAQGIDEMLVPKSPEERAGKIAAFGGELLAGGAPLIKKGIVKTGEFLGSKFTGKGDELIDIAKKPTEYLASRFPKLLGIATGESDDVIRLALKNPEAADLGITGGDVAIRRAVTEGSKKSVELRDAFYKGHSVAFRNLAGANSGKLVKRSQVLDEFYNALDSDVKRLADGTLDFTVSKTKANPGEISKIKDVQEALRNWDDWSLEGVNNLKQLVGKLTKFPAEAGGSSKSPTLGRLYHSLDELIKKSLPKESSSAYAEMNKKFTDSIDLYDDMVDAFNSGDPFTKLAGALGKNRDTLRQTLEFYEKQGGADVLPIVAGRELAMEKTAVFGFLNPRSWIDFFISPATQGKFVTKLGKTRQAQKLPVATPQK